MLREPDKRLLFKFIWNFGWKGMSAVRKYQKRMKKGDAFPAFLFISITNRCNLSCQGCWSTMTDPPGDMSMEELDRIINGCRAQGSYFFGILGGEPFLHGKLFDVIEKYPDCYFLVFTNGLLIDDESARRMRQLGNVSPLISIEGLGEAGDSRRGGRGVYDGAMRGVELCVKNRLITGVATSVCKTNIDDLASERFVDELVRKGVLYVWYYIYRPVGPDPCPELALDREEILRLRRFIVDIRTRAPVIVVDSYWDHDGNALCPAAVGIAHHINSAGDVEPCPPVQFARDNIKDNDDLKKLFNNSSFLRDFRAEVCDYTRGCILMDNPAKLRGFMERSGARDSSGRGRAMEELSAMTARPSHHVPGECIPEKSLMYRFAKKHWFFGFGAYG